MKRIIASVVVATMLFTGCGKNPGTNEANVEASETENIDIAQDGGSTDTEQTDADTKEEGSYSFNYHLRPKRISDLYDEAHWEALFNLCDALRAGEDTFKCENVEAYNWATDCSTLNALFPIGGLFTDDLSVRNEGFENGVGKIAYKIPKDEFVAKEVQFEEDICKVLNDNVKPGYTDFEKCLALFDFVESTCSYDYSDLEKLEPADLPLGGVYGCLYRKKGICNELANYYAYLLCQCDVDAIEIGGDGEEMMHSWTSVKLNGKNYHVDPTWGLKSESASWDNTGSLWLTYFLFTDSERDISGFDNSSYASSFFYDVADKVDCHADSEKYAPLHFNAFEKIDREKKILYYKEDGETKEFKYDD